MKPKELSDKIISDKVDKIISDRINKDLFQVREKIIIENLELLEKYNHPELVRLGIKNNLFKKIKNYSGRRYNEFMDRYLKLK